MIQMNLSMKHKQTHRYREQVVVGKGVGVEEGLYWEFGISRCKLLYREWINKVLHRKLYSISCNKSYGKEQCVYIYIYQSVLSSVTQSCRTLGDPMDCSMPGLPVHHQLLEFTQTHVHWVGDAIQLSHSLSSPSPPTFNLSQHQGLFKWVSSSHQVAKVLEYQLQHQFFQWIFRTDFL